MLTFKNSGIKIPLPDVEVSETDEGWDKVDVLKTEKLKTEESKPKENLQLMKTLNHLQELECAYQKNSEELALEKNKHADTIAENNKNRGTIQEQLAHIDELEKNIAALSKQKDAITHESSENSNLLQAQETYIIELRNKISDMGSNKEKLLQNVRELTRLNETLRKNLDEAKNQSAKIALDYENSKIAWSKEQKYLQSELKNQSNELSRKIELLEKARAQILKAGRATDLKSGVYTATRRRENYSAEEAQSRSIIKYNKRGV